MTYGIAQREWKKTMELAKQWIGRVQCAGTSLVEYGMLLALVSIVAMVVVKTSGGKTASTYDNIQSQMTAQGIGSMAPQAPSGAAASAPSDSGASGGHDRERSNHGSHDRSHR
ncbi:MAG: hypothetical protein WCV00_22505 [Verrucomicrobiia bacterium]